MRSIVMKFDIIRYPSAKPCKSSSLIVAMYLASCSSYSPKPPTMDADFTTKIFDDGSKQFTCVVQMNGGGPKRPAGGPGFRGGRPGGRPPSGMPEIGGNRVPSDKKMHERDDRIHADLEKMLSVELDESQFCREGYFVVEKHDDFGSFYIRGECNEEATESDRKRFPNPKPNNIAEDRLD